LVEKMKNYIFSKILSFYSKILSFIAKKYRFTVGFPPGKKIAALPRKIFSVSRSNSGGLFFYIFYIFLEQKKNEKI